ncbi:hypothetical protein AruPA_05725 [Acidiphilium sp. PA]|uniref:hypothetical protein n=1 Tax=Acidiphilium sp. PA TaxID=2871705 RepID=UPI002243C4F4|nr:hypothetical protein [Acidiphilium sp. PA]MCW8306529.1 hypothetical protein [Acidiphilium sp. PA]
MKKLVRSLIGDAPTLAWVAGSVLLANRLIGSGEPSYAGLLVPLALLIGVGFLARR